MRALVCRRLSDDLSGVEIADIAAPRPGPGELLIEVHSAALNFPDLLMTRGGYQRKPELPFVLGMEGAGVVVEVGPSPAAADGAPAAPAWQVGERVRFRQLGAIAERIVVPAAEASRVPAEVGLAEAASFFVGAITAWVSLVRLGRLARGETLLVHGAAGGMGVAAVQLGRHLGATVIATGNSPERLATVKALGADHVLPLSGGFREQVKALTGGRGADVVFDPVGGDVFDESTRCIAFGGRLLVIGFTSGRPATVASNLVLIKGFSVIGVRAGEYARHFPEHGAEHLRDIDRLFAEGVFRPHVGARFPLEQAFAALETLAERRAVGKVVIDLPAAIRG